MGLALGEMLPPLWHWLAFLLPLEQSRLDRNGHP